MSELEFLFYALLGIEAYSLYPYTALLCFALRLNDWMDRHATGHGSGLAWVKAKLC